MKQLITICASLLVSASGFMATAQDYPQGFKVLEPSGDFVSSVNYIKMAWEYDDATGKGIGLELASKTKYVNITYGGETYRCNFNTSRTPTVENGNELVIDLSLVSGLTRGAGEYSVSIPATLVRFDNGDVNEPVEFSFNVMGSMQGSPEITPAAGEYPTTDLQGKTVTVTYGDYASIEVNKSAGDITVTYAQDGAETNVVNITNPKIDGNALSFELSDQISDKSTVTVNVPQNYILAKNEDGDQFIGGSATVVYTIWNGLPNAEVLACPPLDTPYATPVKLTWGVPVELVGSSLPLTFHGWDSTTKDYFSVDLEPKVSFQENNTVMVLNLSPIIEYAKANNMKPSCYYFDLAEGLVREIGTTRINKGKENIFYFQIQPYCNLVPATVLEDDTFTFFLTSGDMYLSDVNNNVAVHQSAYFINDITGDIITISHTDIIDGTRNMGVDLSKYQFDGGYENYTLHFPFGYFKIADNTDPVRVETLYSLEWNLPLENANSYVGEDPQAPDDDDDGGTSFVESIETSIDAPVEYFNLSGMRLTQPVKGQIVIRRQGDKTSKIIVR